MCLRLREKKFSNIWTPYCIVRNDFEDLTEPLAGEGLAFIRKWKAFFDKEDPFYNRAIRYDIDNLTNPKISKVYNGPVVKDFYGRLIPKHSHGTIHLDHRTNTSSLLCEKVIELYEHISNPILLNIVNLYLHIYNFIRVMVILINFNLFITL